MTDPKSLKLKNELSALLFGQTRLLDHLLHELFAHEELNQDDREIEETIRMMLQSIGASTHSILKLTENIDMSIKDCFGIARTICEMSINVAYIAASGVEVAKRAQMHALQKYYRDLNRTDSTGPYKFELKANNVPNLQEVNGLSEALNMFTKKNGREIRSWSPKSIDQKINFVSDFNKQAGLSLNTSKLSIYRHSSEILHGTLFGIKFFWTSPSGNVIRREEIEDYWVHSHFISIFSGVFFGAAGAIETCIQKFQVANLKKPLDDLFDEATSVILPLAESS